MFLSQAPQMNSIGFVSLHYCSGLNYASLTETTHKLSMSSIDHLKMTHDYGHKWLDWQRLSSAVIVRCLLALSHQKGYLNSWSPF